MLFFLIFSELEVEGETYGEALALGVQSGVLEVEAADYSEGGSLAELVLDDGVEVAVVVDFELGGGVFAELVVHAESGFEDALVVVEDEFSAHGVGSGGGVVEEEEELAEGELVLVEGVVSQAEEAGGGGFPGEAEVVLLQVSES